MRKYRNMGDNSTQTWVTSEPLLRQKEKFWSPKNNSAVVLIFLTSWVGSCRLFLCVQLLILVLHLLCAVVGSGCDTHCHCSVLICCVDTSRVGMYGTWLLPLSGSVSGGRWVGSPGSILRSCSGRELWALLIVRGLLQPYPGRSPAWLGFPGCCLEKMLTFLISVRSLQLNMMAFD